MSASILPDTVTPEELAAQLGWSLRRLKAFARQIGACRILGNRMALTKADVEAILEESRPCPSKSTGAPAKIIWQYTGTVAGRRLRGSTKTTQKSTMLNPRPLQTLDRDKAAIANVQARVSSYAGRLKSASSPRGASLAAANIDAEEWHATSSLAAAEEDGAESEAAALALPVTSAGSVSVFTALQEWEGYVTEIGESVFGAELVDITNRRRHETEKSEFLISDLSESDRNALREGDLFRWVIGYQRLKGGTRQRVSQLYFRRVPAWSPAQGL